MPGSIPSPASSGCTDGAKDRVDWEDQGDWEHQGGVDIVLPIEGVVSGRRGAQIRRMSNPQSGAATSRFVGTIPELYDRHLGPLLFEQYAADLAGRLKLPPSATAVLEIAAGTGIVTE